MNECYGCRLDDPNQPCRFKRNILFDECPCKTCLVKTNCIYFTQTCDAYRSLTVRYWELVAKNEANTRRL